MPRWTIGLITFALAILVAPLAAQAQQPTKVHRVGFLVGRHPMGINEMDPPLCGAVVISQTEVSQTDH